MSGSMACPDYSLPQEPGGKLILSSDCGLEEQLIKALVWAIGPEPEATGRFNELRGAGDMGESYYAPSQQSELEKTKTVRCTWVIFILIKHDRQLCSRMQHRILLLPFPHTGIIIFILIQIKRKEKE